MDNGIQECVNNIWIGIFKNKFVVNGQYITFATPLLISIYQKWQRYYVNKFCIVQAAKMESSHHVNWSIMINRKGAIPRTETESPFLAAKGFNINLVVIM